MSRALHADVRKRITLGTVAAVVALLAQAATADETLTRIFNYQPGSAGAIQVQQWLRDRQAEGQYPTNLTAVDEMSRAFVTGEVTTHAHTKGPTTDLLGGGGTQLPPTGIDGQVIKIDNCVPNQVDTVYTYVWVSDSNGGHWQLIKTVQTVAQSVTCGV